MEKERKIWIDLCVEDNILYYERMILLWNMQDKGLPKEERKPIWIYLHNYGGSVDMMWLFIDVMKTSQTPVYTVNVGACCSAASLIFISGEKRFMMPSAKVVIHEGSAQLSGDAVKVMDASESYKKELKRMKSYILEHTNIPPAQLNRKRNNDWELDAQYCLSNGVCDKVVESLEEVI